MKKQIALLSCLFCLIFSNLFGQNRPVDGQGELAATYRLQREENGIPYTSIIVKYKLTKYAGELVLAAAGKCTPVSREFYYQGKTYNYYDNQKEFDQIRIEDPVIVFDVTGPGFSKSVTLTALTGGTTGILGSNSISLGKVGSQTLDEFTVKISYVQSVRFINTSPLINSIKEKENDKQNLDRYEKLLNDARRIIDNGRDPKETITKIDAIIQQANSVKPSKVPDNLNNLANWISKKRNDFIKQIQEEKELDEKEKEEKETEDKKEKELAEKEKKDEAEKEESKKEVKKEKPLTADEERYLRIARELEREARAMEKKGDELAALGSMFLPDALQMYRASYKKYPLTSVQSKIQKLEQNEMAAKVVLAGAEAIEKGVNKLFDEFDPTGASVKGYAGLQYSSLYRITSYDKKNEVSAPGYTGVNVSFNFLIFTAQARFGYLITQPITTYIGIGYNGGAKVDSGYNQAKGFNAGYAVGITVPFKRIILQATIGDETMPKEKLYSSNFYRKDKDASTRSQEDALSETTGFIKRREVVLGYEIIKEKLGIAFTYSSFKIKEQKNYVGQKVIPYPSATQYSPSTYYKTFGFKDKVNNYSQMGVSLLFRFEM